MVEASKPNIRRCIKCGWLFVSPDFKRIWRCSDCKQQEDSYQPKVAHISKINQAVILHYKDYS